MLIVTGIVVGFITETINKIVKPMISSAKKGLNHGGLY